MSKIGRNNQCPCGSGKKYKHCCMGKENTVIDFNQRAAKREIEHLHQELSELFIRCENDLQDFMEIYLEDQDIELGPDFVDEYTTLFVIWAFFNELIGENGTIFENFMDKHGTQLRPAVKETVDQWPIAPGMFEVVDHIDKDHFIVRKFGTGVRSVVNYEEDTTPAIGNGLIGVLVPFAEEESQFLFAFHEFELGQLRKVFEQYWDGDFEQFEERMRYDFPHILYEIFMDSEDPFEHIATLKWQTEKHRKVAELFCEMNDFTFLPDVQFTAIDMWHSYCEQSNPRVGKEGVFAAALEYLVTHLEENIVTQKEVAEKYKVSPNSVSKRVQDMDDLLFEVLDQMVGMDEMDEQPEFAPPMMEREMLHLEKALEGQVFDSEAEVLQFLNNPEPAGKKKPGTKKEQAQELLFDAYDQPPRERVRTAKKALELYPNSPDAYGILAQAAETLEEMNSLYFKGMSAGEADLGDRYIKENIGHFWGLLETRPYMRVKQGYAETLVARGEIYSAIKQYREMLELNPNDNQGVRYLLLPVLLEAGNYEEAKQLMETYPEATATMNFNRAYLDYAINGWTKQTEELLKEAIKQNSYVPDYLIGKKKIPVREPEFIGMGDENEAILYAADHAHLWQKKELVRRLRGLTAGK